MKTINSSYKGELVVNKSKFITYLFYVEDEKRFIDKLNKIKKEYKEATHFCYAYIIDNLIRFNDDNEPSNTAGKPILTVLNKNNLNKIGCIVVRYFGGKKLGSGGLIRAYSNSVSELLKEVEVVDLVKFKVLIISFDYSKEKEINYLLKGVEIIEKQFTERISYKIKIKESHLKKIKEHLLLLGEIKNITF
ncbi:MAG: IMPACT family protein [Bacilli bacterium]|jgi:uncharacterized YigZ family protein